MYWYWPICINILPLRPYSCTVVIVYRRATTTLECDHMFTRVHLGPEHMIALGLFQPSRLLSVQQMHRADRHRHGEAAESTPRRRRTRSLYVLESECKSYAGGMSVARSGAESLTRQYGPLARLCCPLMWATTVPLADIGRVISPRARV